MTYKPSLIRSWTSSVSDAVKSIQRYQRGEEIPFPTGIPHVDINLLGGLTPRKVMTIGGKSGHGKTYIAQQITRGVFANNTGRRISLLRCNFEMPVQELVIRSLQMETGKSYKNILFSAPSPEEAIIFNDVITREKNPNIFHIPVALSPDEFYDEVSLFLEQHTQDELVIVEVDHCSLIKDSGDKKKAVDALVDKVLLLKQQYDNVFFILIAQLNRAIEERTVITELAPRTSDIYQSSTMEFASDLILISHMPFKLGFQRYLAVDRVNYAHLVDFFEEGNAAWASLKTYKTVFYHYVKHRQSQEEPDIFAECFGVPQEKRYTSTGQQLKF